MKTPFRRPEYWSRGDLAPEHQPAIGPVQPERHVRGSHPSTPAWLVIGFGLYAALLSWFQIQAGASDYHGVIWTGMFHNLLTLDSLGRQAMVSSLHIMPLQGLPALPFLPLVGLRHAAIAYAHGLAILLALATLSLANLLARMQQAPRPATAIRYQPPRTTFTLIIALSLLLILSLQFAGHGITGPLAALACLIMAMDFELRPTPLHRAMAGLFWGCAALSHWTGLIATSGWMIVRMVQMGRALSRGHRWAIAFIQLVSALYLAGIHLFLSALIMRDPLYAVRSFRIPPRHGAPVESLEHAFRTATPNAAPVVSGHWGYLVQPFITEHGGHHVIDFHPDKMPAWDTRDLVLVEPAPGNPLVPFSDSLQRLRERQTNLRGCLLITETGGWRFYAISRHP